MRRGDEVQYSAIVDLHVERYVTDERYVTEVYAFAEPHPPELLEETHSVPRSPFAANRAVFSNRLIQGTGDNL